MSNVQKELESRIAEAAAGYRLGSPELYQQVRGAINQAFADGLLAEAPVWVTPSEVKVQLKPEVRGISLEMSFQLTEVDPA